ncbi:hypothetical protein OIU76_007960 [Salix suchowensis]|nr:hypothetical protein OIU78_011461 [Salix suchowensis]KAJ6338395.1 hypothetical protein OIU76_007960 [Salix suchowensis]
MKRTKHCENWPVSSSICWKRNLKNQKKWMKTVIARQEEVRIMNNSEIQKSEEMIEDLNKKLANCMSTIESKNVELLNLQTTLGQYFAEVEAKEYLEQQLALTREESAKHFQLLKEAERGTEEAKREKEEILAKLSDTEKKFAEG